MSQRMLRRIITAGALAALLALSLPAQAEARELGGRGSMLQWLKNFWGNGISALWPVGEDRQSTAKAGPGIDPNGQPTPPTSGGALCGCDQGPGIDPNG